MAPSDYAGKTAYRGKVALHYEADRLQEPLWATEQAFIEKWAKNLPPQASVLDLPTGTGRFLEVLLARGLRVEAMDVSADMLAAVRSRRCAQNPLLTIRVGDAEKLPLSDGSVDYVLCWRFVHLLPLEVVERVLAEMRRVCVRQIWLQALPVRPTGARLSMPALRELMRRLRRRWRRSPSSPWSHIASFVHAEPDLLAVFERQNLRVIEAHTLDEYNGLPVRVYCLEPRRS